MEASGLQAADSSAASQLYPSQSAERQVAPRPLGDHAFVLYVRGRHLTTRTVRAKRGQTHRSAVSRVVTGSRGILSCLWAGKTPPAV
eukprot:585017-Prymnesium_polylepis.1